MSKFYCSIAYNYKNKSVSNHCINCFFPEKLQISEQSAVLKTEKVLIKF